MYIYIYIVSIRSTENTHFVMMDKQGEDKLTASMGYTLFRGGDDIFRLQIEMKVYSIGTPIKFFFIFLNHYRQYLSKLSITHHSMAYILAADKINTNVVAI